MIRNRIYPYDPPPPQLKTVKQLLARLESGQFLVVHGMPGSGKSVMAAEAVRDPDITLYVS